MTIVDQQQIHPTNNKKKTNIRCLKCFLSVQDPSHKLSNTTQFELAAPTIQFVNPN